MKKIFALILFLSGLAGATTLTGTLKYPDGTGVNGRLSIHLSQVGALKSTGGCGGPLMVSPTADIVITVTAGALVSPPPIYGIDCMDPSGLFYVVTLKDAQGNILFVENWSIAGSTQDIGTIVPSAVPGNQQIFPQITVSKLIGTTTVDFTSAFTQPHQRGLLAAIPVDCKLAQTYFATDAIPGNNIYACTNEGNPGTWTLQGAASGGTVTSVGLVVPTDVFGISNSPVTSAGNITLSKASVAANLVAASPNGSAGAWSFRALLSADIPNLDAAKITTGALLTARGGTGLSTVTQGALLYASVANTWSALAHPGVTNQCLKSTSTTALGFGACSASGVSTVFTRSGDILAVSGDYRYDQIGNPNTNVVVTIPNTFTWKFLDAASGATFLSKQTDTDSTHGLEIGRVASDRAWRFTQLSASDATRGNYALVMQSRNAGNSVDFLSFDSISTVKNIKAWQQLIIQAPAGGTPTYGGFVLTPQSVPTAPVNGTMYIDTTNGAVKWFFAAATHQAEDTVFRGAINGYAPLNASAQLDAFRLPTGANWQEWIVQAPGGTSTWGTITASEEFNSSTNQRTRIDLSSSTSYRILMGISSATLVESGCTVKVQYSNDNTSFSDLESGGHNNGGLDVSTGTNLKVGTFVTVASGAKGDVYLRMIAISPCAGAGDLVMRQVRVQFK